MQSFSPSIRERIVGRERSAFAEQNTKTRLSPTTKQRKRVGKQYKNSTNNTNYTKKRLQNVTSFHQTLNFSINYLAALAVSKTTENASGSLTAKSANIFLFTVMLAFLQALTNLE